MRYQNYYNDYYDYIVVSLEIGLHTLSEPKEIPPDGATEIVEELSIPP